MIHTFSLYSLLFRHVFCVLLLIWTSSIALQAQDRCGTVAYNKMIYGEDISPTKADQFENWISKKITQRQSKKLTSQSKEAAELVTIPIVVHVIHNNEPLGTGLNIPDAQILSQIEVLNEDFRRQNADRVNTPASFVDVAADIEVEFVMARRDPEGLATDAILRVAGTKSSWSMSDNSTLKALSYWPSEDYLNIWVTDLSDLLGFAQFPISDQLDGLEDGSSNALTDGIVVDYQAFGSIDKYPDAVLKASFAKGRTATHEVGHFLGLRHIWGDTGSSQCTTDYCDDTPVQSTSTSGCPSQPASGGCGTTEKMFQNYMDFTNDQCMNLFTLDQNSRMRTVLDNSPRRGSLTTSLALLDPIVYNNDLGIFEITSPENSTCDQVVSPSIVVKNYGNTDISTTEIRLTLNGVVQETLSVDLVELSQLITTPVDFSAITLQEGDNAVQFEIISVNEVTDEGIMNNTAEQLVNMPTIFEASISEDFENGLGTLQINNVDGAKTWTIGDAPNGVIGNQAIFIDYFDYENVGTADWLISETMDFSTSPVVSLFFEYAHAQYPGKNDELSVLITTDCGVSYTSVFNKSGSDLSTTGATQASYFIPNGAADWSSTSIDLVDYIGQSAVQIAFVGKNDYGNNLYLDNIGLITSEATSIKMKQIGTYPIVTVSTEYTPSIQVQNNGGMTINTLEVDYQIDDEPTQSMSIENLDLTSARSEEITLNQITTNEGIHTLSVTVSSPNGEDDVDISDNTLSQDYIVDLSTDGVPLRESFDRVTNWISATRSDVSWETIDLDGDMSMYVNSAQNNNLKGEAWLVSPVLDFSRTTAPYLLFDLSYALSSNTEILKVLLSENGGIDNYPHELYNRSGSTLSTVSEATTNWTPESTDHWRRDSVNLLEYAGADSIRIAFQLINENGNNIYLDNIEFFANDLPAPVNVDIDNVFHFPNPIFSRSDSELNLTFNLEEQQQTNIRIFDLAGNQVFTQFEPYTLNQTFTYDASGLPSGMLILSIIGETFKYNSRITVIR